MRTVHNSDSETEEETGDDENPVKALKEIMDDHLQFAKLALKSDSVIDNSQSGYNEIEETEIEKFLAEEQAEVSEETDGNQGTSKKTVEKPVKNDTTIVQVLSDASCKALKIDGIGELNRNIPQQEGIKRCHRCNSDTILKRFGPSKTAVFTCRKCPQFLACNEVITNTSYSDSSCLNCSSRHTHIKKITFTFKGQEDIIETCVTGCLRLSEKLNRFYFEFLMFTIIEFQYF